MSFHAGHNPPAFELMWVLPPLLILFGIAFLYFLAAVQQCYKRRYWSNWRTASFTAGIGILCIAVSSPLSMLAHSDFRVHMIQHLLIGMLAPLCLVLGAPVTLALRILPVAIARWVVWVMHTELVYWLTHPITTLFLNIGGMFLLYLTPLYKMSLSSTALHYLVHIHFLIAGYLFAWSIAGPDPAPRRPGLSIRIAVLFVAMATHGILSKLMYIYVFPGNTPHSAEEIRSAAKIMYYGGDFAEVLLAIVLLSTWYTKRKLRPYNI